MFSNHMFLVVKIFGISNVRGENENFSFEDLRAHIKDRIIDYIYKTSKSKLVVDDRNFLIFFHTDLLEESTPEDRMYIEITGLGPEIDLTKYGIERIRVVNTINEVLKVYFPRSFPHYVFMDNQYYIR